MTRPMPGPPERASHDRHSAAGFIRSDCPWCGSFRPDESKSLTDAECAAEVWRERAEWWAGMHTRGRSAEDVDIRRTATWERFATHPHADLDGETNE